MLSGRQPWRLQHGERAKSGRMLGRIVFRRQYASKLAQLRHLILYYGHIHARSARCMAAFMHGLERLEVVRLDVDRTCAGFRHLRELLVDRIKESTLRLLAVAAPALVDLQVCALCPRVAEHL
jgi:hypothetical protein